jgi:serine/threonine-protein kinase HipA
MAADIEVHIDFAGGLRRVGTLYRHAARGGETTTFEYHPDWLADPACFSLEPALQLGRGAFQPPAGKSLFGSIGDSAPDTWGRQLMQRRERRMAQREHRAVRTLMEPDFLLGVSDISRLGALRFRYAGEEAFQAPSGEGVPGLIQLGKLLNSAERIERGEETDEDLQMIFAPGSSLGGARPKASVIDQNGLLAIAKFPKESDDHSVETWEGVALTLAGNAGIRVPTHELLTVNGKKVLLSRRFDRQDGLRIPFLSALSMMGLSDGERASYPEIVDMLSQYGAQATSDAHELYRRVVFNVLISNDDDHLRNHGFLWQNTKGWTLSPAYDLNPVPVDQRQRILTTKISLDDGTCDIDLVVDVAGYFALSTKDAKSLIKEVAHTTQGWRSVANALGAPKAEIDRMASAFEHDDLKKALDF